MKSIVYVLLVLVVMSCHEDRKAKLRAELTRTPEIVGSSSAPKAVIHHYICLNNCKGSGSDSEGNCPVCGQPYTHNDDFHVQADPVRTPVPNSIKEPAQNDAGVWHYICPKGCEGGSGEMVLCPKCQTQMVHNVAYHNK